MTTTRRLVGLSLLLLALLSPAWAGEKWVLWQKKEGQTSDFNDTWTPVGGYESERGCRAMRKELLSRYRRADVTAVSADAVRVRDPLGWWLTYACRPGRVPPK
jgi:hypothetical protein